MNKDRTKECVTEEARRLARVDRGTARLQQLSLPFPGGDDCPARVIRGLAKLRRSIEREWGPKDDFTLWDDEERAAMDWIDMWLEAGADMLPKDG